MNQEPPANDSLETCYDSTVDEISTEFTSSFTFWNLCGDGVSVLVMLVHEQMVCWCYWFILASSATHVDPNKNGKAELRPPIQPLSEFVNILINCQI